MNLQFVRTPNAPTPGGHYSQAVVYNGLVFVSGQLPIDPRTGKKNLGPIEEQATQVLTNIREILQAAGSDMNQVLKMTVYVSDIGYWDAVNRVYTEFLGDHRPARAVIPTRDLHYGFLVEIDAIAATSAS